MNTFPPMKTALVAACLVFAPLANAYTCTAADLRGQQRYWLFGKGTQIDFGVSGNSHTVSQITPPVLQNREGNVTVTQGDGTLQFWVSLSYSPDVATIYNRNHSAMSNGTGLLGHFSAAQGATAFPSPTVPGRYFVITNHTAYPTAGQLYYHVVDMNADGGLGAVTSKNMALGPAGTTDEALTAVPNANGTGHWVISANAYTKNLVAHQFDSNGPTTGAGVVSTDVLDQPPWTLQTSIYAHPTDPSILVYNASGFTGPGGSGEQLNMVYLLKLDRATGQITKLSGWRAPQSNTNPHVGTYGPGYMADFSPSGKYVYVSTIVPGRVWRYKVSDFTNGTAIGASEQFIGNNKSPTGNDNVSGAIRRGPDGAMWLLSNRDNTAMTRIADPDADVPTFVYGNVSLPPGSEATTGFPQISGGCAAWEAHGPVPPATPVPVDNPLALFGAAAAAAWLARRQLARRSS